MYKIVFLISCYLAIHLVGYSQLPSTQIYAFNIRSVDDSVTFSNAKYLTGFNDAGYNSQPSFINNNELLITSNYFDPNQTDIIRLHLAKETLTRVTATSQGEYSPTLMMDRRHFSVIKETMGGDINQVLWGYPLSQANSGNLLIENEYRVGYHCWLSGSEVATFLVDEPHQLVIFDLLEDSKMKIADNPGRSLLNVDGKLIYIDKSNKDNWNINSYDPSLNQIQVIAPALPNSEDMVFMEPSYILMGSKSKLYRLDLRDPESWKEMADLQTYGIKNINRLAQKGNRLIIVNAK